MITTQPTTQLAILKPTFSTNSQTTPPPSPSSLHSWLSVQSFWEDCNVEICPSRSLKYNRVIQNIPMHMHSFGYFGRQYMSRFRVMVARELMR